MVERVLTNTGCGLEADSCARPQRDSLMGNIQNLSSVEVEAATELVSAKPMRWSSGRRSRSLSCVLQSAANQGLLTKDVIVVSKK